MRLKFLITGDGNSLNNGVMAMALSLYCGLEKIYPNSEFGIFSAFSFEEDKIRYGEFKGVRVIRQSWLRKRNEKKNIIISILRLILFYFKCLFFKRVSKSINNEAIEWYKNCDIVLDISGDSVSDDYGKRSTLFQLITLFFASIFEKKIVLVAQSIGPFNYFVTKKISKYVLNRATCIILREKISYDILKKMNIKPKLYLNSDLAFILKPEKDEKVNDILIKEGINLESNKKTLGVSLSYLLASKLNFSNGDIHMTFVKRFSRMIDRITERFNVNIIFIPHVTISYNNDRDISEKVVENIKRRKNIFIIKKDYNAKELKGIIGRCDLFVAARMHAGIAAISQMIPTIVLSYNHKTLGIFRDYMRLDDLVIDVKGKEVLKELEYKIVKYLNKNNCENNCVLLEKIEKSVILQKEKSLESFEIIKKVVST